MTDRTTSVQASWLTLNLPGDGAGILPDSSQFGKNAAQRKWEACWELRPGLTEAVLRPPSW